MTTRAEVATEYTLDENGCIRTPGRFEAEPWWIVQVAEWDMDSGGEILSSADDWGGYASLFDVTHDETSAFGLSADTVAILYTIGDQGFCSVEELTAEEVSRVRDQAEENASLRGEDY